MFRGKRGVTRQAVLMVTCMLCIGPQAFGVETDGVAFDAEYSAADLGWDSGWYPPGDPEPGGATIQVRLMYGAAAQADAHVTGDYVLEDDVLAPDVAAGSWDYDFGAEVMMKIAFNINFTIPNPFGDDFEITPFVIDVPFVPNFDLRSTQSTTFSSYLLDTSSTLGETTEPVKVYDLDLIDLIIGKLGLPDWVKSIMNAGAALNVAIETDAELSCDNMTLSDETVFTSEGQQQVIEGVPPTYSADVAYNESFTWDLTLHNTPSVFIAILGQRWEYPITDIPWNVYSGPLDLEFNEDTLSLPFAEPNRLELTAPTEGEELLAGEMYTITWTSEGEGVGPDVRLALHRGDDVFIDWIIRRTENDGEYTWLVPSELDSGQGYNIRVQSFTDASIRDFGPLFSIIRPPLLVTAPNGGEVWTKGSAYAITWTSISEVVGLDVRIGLHDGAEFLFWISRRTANDGEYTWMVPADVAVGDKYRIRVQSFSDASIRDYSDQRFSVEAPPLMVTAPNGRETWTIGETYTITWESNSPDVGPDVRIGLHQGKLFVDWLARKTENNGTWDWTVPAGLVPAANYSVRLQSYTDSSIRDYSDARFSIVAK
ncbi:MAG TPA: GPI anchored serine-threonine rich family protein [Candidatus Hydrogenedentes bacterium]|nr:GPI anchored serine-threonine rich family protein [Candidatus Hydrogenedentota bacterium]HPG69813.1 GPI anchored serine-threonine rich family protein [Candidatus Hydrogenedentota bacterium]